MSVNFTIFIFSLFLVLTKCIQDEITPKVWIYEEHPARVSGRVKSYPNTTVEIIGYVKENIVMQCNVFNMPRESRIYWIRRHNDIVEYINDGLMSRDMSRWFVGQGKQPESIRLEILSLDSLYEGKYSCECLYSGSVIPVSVERYLRVVQKPQIIQYESSYSIEATKDDRVTLKCNATGIPRPTISWRRTGGSSGIIRNYGAEKSGVSIIFEKVEAADAGEYICFAKNEIGESIWPVELKVRHDPVVSIYPADPKQKVGCKLMLLCDVSANPTVSYNHISWSNDMGKLEDSDKYHLKFLDAGRSKFLTLQFKYIEASDFTQQYRCSANNFLGSAEKRVRITESKDEVKLLNGRPGCSALSCHVEKMWIGLMIIFTIYLIK